MCIDCCHGGRDGLRRPSLALLRVDRCPDLGEEALGLALGLMLVELGLTSVDAFLSLV